MMSEAGLGGSATPHKPRSEVAAAGCLRSDQSNWSTGQLPASSRWRDLFPLPPCEPSPKVLRRRGVAVGSGVWRMR